MANKGFRRVGLGAAAAATVTAALLAGGGMASAAPPPVPGSSAGSVEDGGRALLNFGSSILGIGPQKGPSGPSGPPAVQKCNESTQSGHDGITDTIHQLGVAGPTAFVLSYETYNVPDKIEVFYQGRRVLDTGFVGDNNASGQGTGSATVRLPRGTSASVLVRVTGGSSTDWDYRVACPVS